MFREGSNSVLDEALRVFNSTYNLNVSKVIIDNEFMKSIVISGYLHIPYRVTNIAEDTFWYEDITYIYILKSVKWALNDTFFL